MFSLKLFQIGTSYLLQVIQGVEIALAAGDLSVFKWRLKTNNICLANLSQTLRGIWKDKDTDGKKEIKK